MAMNKAVPRLSAGLFSGIIGILEGAAIEGLSINVESITIEKLSSERLYSRGGKEAGYFYPLPVCGKRDDVPRVVCFQVSLISSRENHATLQASAEGREKSVSLHQENSLFLRSATFFRIMKARR